jgi:hypothetical protein
MIQHSNVTDQNIHCLEWFECDTNKDRKMWQRRDEAFELGIVPSLSLLICVCVLKSFNPM